MSTGAVFFAHKKRITERNSHLAGEASGSSISNGCQAKTERRRQLATAAPWEPYFTDNPRISVGDIFHTKRLNCNKYTYYFTKKIVVRDYHTGIIYVMINDIKICLHANFQ
jgi:hypothetical protein